MAVAGVAGKPLRLKDFLELDCESCSAAGFRCYPRRLCVAGAAPSSMRRLQLEPSLRPKLSHLSRSLSRRLRGGFWRRREEDEAPVANCCSCSDSEDAAPVAGCCNGSDSEALDSGPSSTEVKSESDFYSANSASGSLHAGAAEEHEVMERRSKDSGSTSEMDDKAQLSPVGVMDFPFDDEEDVVEEERDGGTGCSASFSDRLAQLQRRRKLQPQHKIGRFTNIEELGAVDLEARFAASEPDVRGCMTAPARPNAHRSVINYQESDEHSLLLQLKSAVSVGVDDVSERLLLSFFAEARKLGTSKIAEAVKLAQGWLEGTGEYQWGLRDVLGRDDLVLQMEWARVGEEDERDVGLVVVQLLSQELLGELLNDLVCWRALGQAYAVGM